MGATIVIYLSLSDSFLSEIYTIATEVLLQSIISSVVTLAEPASFLAVHL